MAIVNVTKEQMESGSLGYTFNVVRAPLVVLAPKFDVTTEISSLAAGWEYGSSVALEGVGSTDDPFAASAITDLFNVSAATAAYATGTKAVNTKLFAPLWISSAGTSVTGFSKTANTSETQVLDGQETATVTRDSTSWDFTMSSARHSSNLPYYVADTTNVTDPLGFKAEGITLSRIVDMLYEADVTALLYYRADATAATSATNPLIKGMVKVTTGPALAQAEAGQTGLQTEDYTFTGQGDITISYAP